MGPARRGFEAWRIAARAATADTTGEQAHFLNCSHALAMLPAHSAIRSARTPAERRTLRLRRFGMASSTYVLGLVILALCWQLDLLPGKVLVQVAMPFLLLNGAMLMAFVLRWNERFADP